jgi:selenocysteine lyase/cysteine desulfurase
MGAALTGAVLHERQRMTLPVPGLLDLDRVRPAFPVLEDVVYLNIGTYGIMPAPALEQFQALQAQFEVRGIATGPRLGEQVEATRQRVAALVGADAEEIAFTRNATDGINLVLSGIDWRAGDELIITDEEHEAVNHPSLYLKQTCGIVVKRLPVSPQDDVMLARLAEAASDRTRLIVMSLVSCETGTRLPAQAISAWAAKRGILTLFDGAQVSGALPIDLRAIGCDFYTSNGHKWLGGPKGTGFFYNRRDKIDVLKPAHIGAGSLEKVDLDAQTVEVFQTGQRFEFGTRAWPLQGGLGYSLDWFEALGWERVYQHIHTLNDFLKDCILERPYLKLLTPLAFEASSGLTTFVIEGHSAQQVANQLRERWKIYTRVIPHFNAMRIATAHFNSPEDVERLMRGLGEIVRG